MSSYFNCNIFEKAIELASPFSFIQQELCFDPSISSAKEASFRVRDVEYTCKFEKRNFTPEKPTVLIPIKDQSKLLQVTINNLKENQVSELANILIIDDRSDDDLTTICENENVSYLRVDNEQGFNFSVLNNIAAKICSDLGNKTIVLWNSDLWCANTEYFEKLLKNHKEKKSKLSGCKLVYPPAEMSMVDDAEYDNDNIRRHFPHYLGSWREKIQFGGDYWMQFGPAKKEGSIPLLPIHARRFKEIDDPIASTDKPIHFTTGALQVWDLEHFIKIGGFNPSLAKSFQDVDICLRSIQAGHHPWYFGKDIYFYHDESYSLTGAEKKGPQSTSDNVLFMRLWQELHTLVV